MAKSTECTGPGLVLNKSYRCMMFGFELVADEWICIDLNY